MPSGTRDLLAAVVEPVVVEAGYDLEDVAVSTAGRRTLVRLTIDRDGGFTLDDVADVSRAVSAALDDADTSVVPGAYVLEVSSPGVDRPLTAERHWRRNVGRLVEVRLKDGSTVTGRIVDSEPTLARLDVDGAERAVAYADVARAHVQIEFNRPASDQDQADGRTADGDTADGDTADGDEEE